MNSHCLEKELLLLVLKGRGVKVMYNTLGPDTCHVVINISWRKVI